MCICIGMRLFIFLNKNHSVKKCGGCVGLFSAKTTADDKLRLTNSLCYQAAIFLSLPGCYL